MAIEVANMDDICRDPAVLPDILQALHEAIYKHPIFPTDLGTAHLVLAEEVGEVAKAIYEYRMEGKPKAEIGKEVAQVAAVCIRLLSHLPESE